MATLRRRQVLTGRSRAGAILLTLIILTLVLLATAGSASAKQLQLYKFQSSFDGSDSTAGTFSTAVNRVEINGGNGNVYVLDPRGSDLQLSQFNAAGQAQPWLSLPALSSFSAGGNFNSDMAFDNSGHGGGLYVSGSMGSEAVRAFNPDGTVRLSSFGSSGNRCGIGVDHQGFVWYGPGANHATKYDPDTGHAMGLALFEQAPCHMVFDSAGHFYLQKTGGSQGGLYKYGAEAQGLLPPFFRISYVSTPYMAIDHSNDHIYALEGTDKVTEYSPAGQPITTFGLPDGPYTGLASAQGVAVNSATHDVYVTSSQAGKGRVDIFDQAPPITVPDATTMPGGHPNGTSAVLKGILNPDGVATTQCKFEWGSTTQYSNGVLPCAEGDVFTGSGDQNVSSEIKSLTLGSDYHYRVAAKNANGHWSYGADRVVEASTPPTTSALFVDQVNTDGARFSIDIDPNGGTTSYHFEFGPKDCATNPCTSLPQTGPTLASKLDPARVAHATSGLSSDTGYFVRLIAENSAGKVITPYFFHTYPPPPSGDPCANSQVRQQTGASFLPDCRAYELVSAANAGGYDVESDLVPGQAPFTGYPSASDRLLYGLHFGSVPGVSGEPTNYGLDPYLAERGPAGWTTSYVGLPAGGMADATAFGSPLLAADQTLQSFVFGGLGICDPCFAGAGTNLPLRLHGGPPVPGMVGSQDPGALSPAGAVRKYISADGSSLVFGSTKQLEPAASEGLLTIYERDLITGTTQVVSTDPAGATLSGPGIAALDVSADGSRVVTGKLVSTDVAGNEHHHLYMHIGSATQSADLTPGVAGSALFNGMTADGSRVFFSTADKLLVADTDASIDVYEADVDPGGAVDLRLISIESTGAASNDDSCAPPGSPESWNSVTAEGKCNAVAFGGGAGVASAQGTFYFVSPEQLDGADGIADQANLYVVEPGENPRFVATIDSSLGEPGPAPPTHPLLTSNFTGTSHSGPESLAIDQSNGDLYVAETSAGKIARYTSAGAPKEFSAVQPYIEGNKIKSLNLPGNSSSQLALDNAPSSPFNGSIYSTNASTVNVYSPTGEKLGELNGSAAFTGTFSTAACGVAVDQSNGTVYIGTNFGFTGAVFQYTPKPGAVAPIDDSDYTVKAVILEGILPCNVAADSAGHVYASQVANGPVYALEASAFAAPFANQSGTQVNASSRALATDPLTNDLYVDEGAQIAVFNSSQERTGTIGAGVLSGSRGVALNGTSHHLYASSGTNVVEFGFAITPYRPIDNPGIVNGVQQSAIHTTSDFQVTPDGRYAAFGSDLSLTGYENVKHMEIFRYEPQGEDLQCASCASTGAAAATDTFLAPHGLNISEDGRVFFTSLEGLVLSDTNGKGDVYEWSGGTKLGRISTGRSLSDSSLLTVSQDGEDVFFFTRDVLVPEDQNGGAVKVYDARQGGGYLQGTSPPPCAASDECHGPGTQAPPPPNINSVTGAGPIGELPKKKQCRKGFVKRSGKCIRKKSRQGRRGRHRVQGDG